MDAGARTGGIRRRLASLLLLAAGVGAFVAIGPKLPRDHDVALDLGSASAEVTDVELMWTNPRSPGDEAALVTQWHFAVGGAPSRLHAQVRLADGPWDATVAVERAGRAETTRWSSRVNLEGPPFWKREDRSQSPVVLPVREVLR